MSTVSVIIPTWNRSNSIKKAILSVINQTYPPNEILICDDGSTDDTESIVKSMSDDRIHWLSGEHSGLPATPRNRGIKNSQGEWLAFLDSDDEWVPDKLDKQLKLANELNCKAITSNAHRHLPNQGIVGDLIQWEDKIIKFDDLIKNNWIITSSTIIHRSLLVSAKGFPENQELQAIEDYCLWLRIATQTYFGYVSEALTIYNDDPNNSVRKESVSYYLQRYHILKNLLNWLNIQDKNIKKIYFFQTKEEYKKAYWQIKKQNIKNFKFIIKDGLINLFKF